MPYKALKRCSNPRCSNLAIIGLCEECRKQQPRKGEYGKRQDKEAIDFYSSARWKRLRKAYRKNFPVCQQCAKQDRIVVGELVDHIVPISRGGSKLRWDNLQTLCRYCHDEKTRRES